MAAYDFALFKFKAAQFSIHSGALLAYVSTGGHPDSPFFQAGCKSEMDEHVPGIGRGQAWHRLWHFHFRQFMENLPQELMDAARVDGASHFRVYWSIIMPLSWNAILTVIVLNASASGEIISGRW